MPNDHVLRRVSMIWATMMGENGYTCSTTELDSHANMFVVGAQAFVIQHSGRHAEVNAFSDEVDKLTQVPIVDACFAYDCPRSLKTYLLIARNALHVPSMDHNLVPPFLLREAGIDVRDVPKIHCHEATVEDHSLYFADSNLRIPLKLNGVFSYFPTRALTQDEIDHCEDYDCIFLTPDSTSWNPHCDSYAKNEESFLDHRGDMVYRQEPEHRTKRLRLIEDEDVGDISAVDVGVPMESIDAAIDAVIASSAIPQCMDASDAEKLTFKADAIRAHVADVSCALDPFSFASTVADRAALSKFTAAIGCTTAVACDTACQLFTAVTVSATHAEAPKGVSPELLSKIWRIDQQTAKRTLEVTSQLNKQDGDSSLARNFSTNDRMQRYRRLKSFFFSDTFFVTKEAKSTRGFTCMQLFVSDKGFIFVVPMKSVAEFPHALRMFAKEVGVPQALIVDPHRAQTSKEVQQFCHKIGTTLRVLEESTQFANRAELYIGLMKESIRKDIRETHSPLVLWDYCAERRALIFNLTAKNLFQLQGQNPYTATFGEEGDISNLCQFGWYEWVYFRDGSQAFPTMRECLGRCLGPAKNEGNEMAQWILKMNGQIVPRRSLRRLSEAELNPTNEIEIRKRQAFDNAIAAKLGDSFSLPPTPLPSHLDDDDAAFVPYEDDEESPIEMPDADAVDAAGTPVMQQSLADTLINAEVLLPQGESKQLAKVIRRSVDADGHVIGTFNKNPILNTLLYDVEFPDGVTKQYAANLIAENILCQVDSDGRYSSFVDGILEYRRNKSAVTKENQYVVTKRGRRKLRQTTVGWDFLVQWKDGTTQWLPLKLLKESNPVDVAEFVTARGIADEPAFCWWVPYTLRKRDRIIASVNSRIKKRNRKYGIEVPTSIEDARRLDKENGNTLWQDAIAKEMYNVSIAFQILEPGESVPPGWTKSSGHIIFDVKMDFTRKARWVKDGHRTPDPESSSYAGVVSRESVRIALTYAALNDIDILAADIRNAYLQAPSSEKHYIICGAEFGLEHVGKKALIRRALYGGKVAGRDFWHHLRDCMGHLGFRSSKADPDVWMRPAVRTDKSEYYEYVLLYVDDCLVLSEKAEDIIRKEIGKYFELKEESIGPPDIYLGGKLRRVVLENGSKAWAFGSSQYVQNAVKNVEEYLKGCGESLPARASSPISNNYRPEVDVTEELEGEAASYYHSLIGVLRWIVELGRVDIDVEVSMMSSHLALPRKGHLQQLFHIFAYLKKHHNAEMVFDPSDPVVESSQFERQDWSHTVYGDDLVEELPPDMPPPRGQGFRMRVFVDSDHAGDTVTRRSRTGFLVYLNCAPIYWLSKKQTSCETSTFGSEFVAMKQATEYVRGLRYKLRMMGIPVEEPTLVYGDNQSVLANTTMPSSTLKKKSNSIAYHFVREGCARDEWRTTYINTHLNPADMLTKPLPPGEKRSKFVRMVLHHL